jgi:hypothetical protein
VAGSEHYDDVSLSVQRQDDQGVFTVYLMLGDLAVPFGVVKTGTVDELRERHAAKQTAQDASPQSAPSSEG